MICSYVFYIYQFSYINILSLSLQILLYDLLHYINFLFSKNFIINVLHSETEICETNSTETKI